LKFNKNEIVVVCISGRGDKDMAAYSRMLNPKG
jgi:tryptophan synthase beta subunit